MSTITFENYNDNKKKLNHILTEHQKEHNQDIYNRKETISFAIYNNKDYAGGLVGTLIDHTIHIERLAITKEYRKQGYGTSLFNKLKTYAKAKNCHTITVTTLNFQGKAFYLSNGFELFGELKNVPNFGSTKYYLVLNI